jgi:hypothetical protein
MYFTRAFIFLITLVCLSCEGGGSREMEMQNEVLDESQLEQPCDSKLRITYLERERESGAYFVDGSEMICTNSSLFVEIMNGSKDPFYLRKGRILFFEIEGVNNDDYLLSMNFGPNTPNRDPIAPGESLTIETSVLKGMTHSIATIPPGQYRMKIYIEDTRWFVDTVLKVGKK